MRDYSALDWDNASEFTILIDDNVPTDDWLELLQELNALDLDVMAEPAGAGPMENIVVGVSIFKDAVEATKYAIAAVKIVQGWIAKQRKKGIEPDVRLQEGFMHGVKVTVETDEDVDVTVIVRRRKPIEQTEA